MKRFVKLDQSDIVKILAKEFQVDEDKVVVTYEKVYDGYGINDHYKHKIAVTIEQ